MPSPRSCDPAMRRPAAGPVALLRRVIRHLRAAFHSPTIRVRLDGGFATPTVFAFLEAEQVEYVVGMPSNTRLEKRARRLMRSEEHTSELQSLAYLVCRLLLEKKKKIYRPIAHLVQKNINLTEVK